MNTSTTEPQLTAAFKAWEQDLRTTLRGAGASPNAEEAVARAVMGAVAKSWPLEAFAPEVHEALRPALDGLKRAHASLAADLMVACIRLYVAGQPLPNFHPGAQQRPDTTSRAH